MWQVSLGGTGCQAPGSLERRALLGYLGPIKGCCCFRFGFQFTVTPRHRPAFIGGMSLRKCLSSLTMGDARCRSRRTENPRVLLHLAKCGPHASKGYNSNLVLIADYVSILVSTFRASTDPASEAYSEWPQSGHLRTYKGSGRPPDTCHSRVPTVSEFSRLVGGGSSRVGC